MGKRTFTREFKLEAVRMVKERSLAKAQVARDIGVHANVLKNWLDQHDTDPQGAFGGTSAKTLEIAQIEQLKRELNRVTAERDILKNRRERCEVKYAFIARHRQVWPIRWQCAALSVSTSGFYEWLSRAESNRAKANRELLVAIRTSFSNSDQAYGSPRVWRDVRAWGHQVGEHRVARFMRKSKLVARPKRRRWPKDAGPRPEHALAPNTLERRFDAAAPNVRWIADFTYLWTRAHRDYRVRIRVRNSVNK